MQTSDWRWFLLVVAGIWTLAMPGCRQSPTGPATGVQAGTTGVPTGEPAPVATSPQPAAEAVRDRPAEPSDAGSAAAEQSQPKPTEAPAGAAPEGEVVSPGKPQGDRQPPAAAGEIDKPQPLVDDPRSLRRLDPEMPVWITADRKSVVVMAAVCQRNAPLEVFACLRGSKEYESVLVVDAKAHVIHAGLLAVGASPGSPVRFYPQYAPARGPQIEVAVVWKDAQGKVCRGRGQDWVRDQRTGKAMQYPWVFGGSQFVTDEQNGERYYRADYDGDLISVSNFVGAVLDVPVKSTDSNSELMFEAFTQRIPRLGTPVTVILTPKAENSTQPAAGAK